MKRASERSGANSGVDFSQVMPNTCRVMSSLTTSKAPLVSPVAANTPAIAPGIRRPGGLFFSHSRMSARAFGTSPERASKLARRIVCIGASGDVVLPFL